MRDLKLTDIFPYHNTYPQDRLVGLEIEMEGRGLLLDMYHLPRWVSERDGSLRGESAEYKLREPLRPEDVSNEISNLIQASHDFGSVFDPSARCAVHVHLNCQHLQFKRVLSIMVVYFILEDLFTHWCGDGREGNLFCLRARDAEGVISAICHMIQNNNYSILAHPETLKYASLNISALSHYGTLEWRTMETPHDLAAIDDWIKMLIRLHRKSQAFSTPNEIIEMFSGQGEERFLTSIMGKYSEQLKFPGWEARLSEGMRRAQDICLAWNNPIKEGKSSGRNRGSGNNPFGERMQMRRLGRPDNPPEPPRDRHPGDIQRFMEAARRVRPREIE